MKFNKAQKFAALVVVGVAAGLYLIQHTQAVTLDWNGMFNGVLQTIIGTFIGAAFTITIYRKLYHGRSKD